MEMKNFDKEYVQRTKKIIETMPKDYEYEVTLLLNCLNGLVCLPVEKEQDKASAGSVKIYAQIFHSHSPAEYIT